MKDITGFLLAILTCSISVISMFQDMKEFDSYILVHILIVFISSFSLFSYIDRPFSLFKIFHVFYLFFFGIAPVFQYYKHVRFEGEPLIPDDVKLIASITVLLSMILYNGIYYLVNLKFSNKDFVGVISRLNKFKQNDKKFTVFLKSIILLFSMFSFFVIFASKEFNVFSMVFRGGILEGISTSSKSSLLLIEKFFRPLSLVLFIISYSYNKKAKFFNFILFMLFLMTAFPLAIARNAAAGFYLPLLLLFVPVFRKRHFFVSSMIFGLLIVFPFLNNFRKLNENSKIEIGLDFYMFLEMHFDAYATFTRVIYHDIITYGHQLLGVFLFFVPRFIWSSKPLSSGQFHANEIGMTFDNLACAYIAEGYINFGYFGVVLFTVFLSYASAILDKTYWNSNYEDSFFKVIYVFIIGMFLFVLRGDLMNSYAYTFGLVFTALVAYKGLLFFSKIKV